MKTLYSLLFLLVVFSVKLFAQDLYPNELTFVNFSSTTPKKVCHFRIYPVSMVFNGNYRYCLRGLNNSSGNPIFNYIDGVSVIYNQINHTYTKYTIFDVPAWPDPASSIGFNNDITGASGGAKGNLGFGIYKVYISVSDPGDEELTYNEIFTIEWDNNYNQTPSFPDLVLRYKDDGNDQRITFQWGTCDEMKVRDIPGKQITAWNQCVGHTRLKDYGPEFFDGVDVWNNYLPQDARRDCLAIWPVTVNENNIYHDSNGKLTLDLVMEENTETPTYEERVDFPTYITIPREPVPNQPDRNINFTINSGITILIAYDPWYPNNSNRYTQISNYGNIILNPYNAHLILENKNRFYLYEGSLLSIGQNSSVIVKVGAYMCSYGGFIKGPGKIIWEHGLHSACFYGDFVVHDSTNVILEDSVSWEIPDNTTISLDSNASMILNPNCVIKFGQNSKLLLKNGSHLIANNATFTSVDPNSTWDGIYLEGVSNDTLKYCTIENAASGINIIDKSGSGMIQPSTEISNCTFSNTTTTQLSNGIYASNSNNVLIRKNTFTSSQLTSGFATAIWLEYCPSGNFDIIDNNIGYVTTGITSIQSSPYIARNVITGQTASGNGFYLDNTNGTNKYNLINNFQYSLYSLYSSPYLLKNTLSNASDRAMDISANSVPVMRPINSGSTLSWLGGNNLISGEPQNAGIGMKENAYPSMDSGYNRIEVGTKPYIDGSLPGTMLEMYVKYNYWGGTPNPLQFTVTGGDIIYEPALEDPTTPPTDYYNLNDIGFGLYDTVYVENLGDNPAAEQLYMQAYQNEMQRNYAQAILLYKQVIQNYRTSDYASISLSRIFNCLEKKISLTNEYQQLQTYMNQLRVNSVYSTGIRELAEDFMIKSKVRQGLLSSAINDYDQIYQHNLNNAKGLHALINKECLTVMLRNGGDNPNGGQQSYDKVREHKNNLLTLITGGKAASLRLTVNSTIPKQFKLYQNYPNPFNPATTIKYDLPKNGNVTLKVYDLLGREIYSVNEYKIAGSYELKFDGSNYASGLYFYRIEEGNFVEVKKMVLVK